MKKNVLLSKILRGLRSKELHPFDYIYITVFGYLALFAIFATRYRQFQGIIFLDAIIAVALMVALRYLVRSSLLGKLANLLEHKIFVSVFFVSVLLVHLCIAYSLSINPLTSGWDPQTMYQSSANFTESVKPYPDTTGYLELFSNTLGIVGLLNILHEIASLVHVSDFIDFIIVGNVLAMNAAFLLLYLCARRIGGNRAALLAIFFGLFFITFSLWSQTFYSDTIGLLFPIASLYLILRLMDSRKLMGRILWSVLLGLCGGIGYLVKPTTIFVLVAFLVLVAVPFLHFHRIHKNFAVFRPMLLVLPIILLVTIAVTIGGQKVLAKSMDLTLNTMPASHFAMMGLSEDCSQNECRYGAWNLPDALALNQFKSIPVYEDYTVDTINSRLSNYGVDGYPIFLSKKGAWILGDGTFYAYHEGTGAQAPLLHRSSFNRTVQTIMHPTGAAFSVSRNILQVAWIAVLLASLTPISLKRPGQSLRTLTLIRLSLLGLLAFLLLFEARSRYLYLYVPLFILLASYGLVHYKVANSNSAKKAQ